MLTMLRQNEGRKEGKCLEENKNIYASHLLVLSSMSSETLQALPAGPLILVTSHKLSVFTTLAGPARSSL